MSQHKRFVATTGTKQFECAQMPVKCKDASAPLTHSLVR